MARLMIFAVALAALAGCGGNPFIADPVVTPPVVDPDDPVINTHANGVRIPAEIQGHLNSAIFTPGAATISVNMSAQDAVDLNGTYQRNTDFDVAGYTGYSYQETTSNRYVVALVAEVNGTKVMIAEDSGQFVNAHAGGIYSRAAAFVAPTTGTQNEFNYSGSYVGLLNFGDDAPGGPGAPFNPTIAHRTTGEFLFTADFIDMQASGAIRNRSDVVTGAALPDQFLAQTTTFDSAGNFGGVTKFDPQNSSGVYSGIFAGTNASEVAALLVFTPIPGNSSLIEQGMFIGTQCSTAGGPACP